MLRINQIRLSVGHSEPELRRQIQRRLRLKDTAFTYRIAKKSIDARKKPELYYVYSVLVQLPHEARVQGRLRDASVRRESELRYRYPPCGEKLMHTRPVIVGAGPAGLFSALQLAESGFAPIVVERGRRVEERAGDVEEFWRTGVLKPDSNVQFGEGGAGTFSDGKLNTAVRDPSGRNSFVLNTFVRFGAPEQILYEAKPHIGTDRLRTVIKHMRTYLESLGVTFYFETKLTGLIPEGEGFRTIRCETAEGELTLDTEALVLALGHSARDTVRMLAAAGLSMEAKSFAVGFRVEHPQRMIDLELYGRQDIPLPAASYKVAASAGGRGVYSFCMCPGGYVVNASSEAGGTAVNGMSYSGRKGSNANSAIILSVTPADFGGGALDGLTFQERLERNACSLGAGRIPQQLYGDFVQNVVSSGFGDFPSETKGAAAFANLRGLLGEELERDFCEGMSHFAGIISNFDRKDAILSGIETRTSSPVRILRNERGESLPHIYPCGEGAGYAGGIVSAAIDGLCAASHIMEAYRPMK